MNSACKGFSLVELSIVLVILGLLVGGVLTGQSLIRAAELRSVTTEFQRYQTAVQTFRDRFFALPGDMRNATDFWGEFGDAAAGACPDTAGTGTETCNGDGDGQVDNHAASREWWQFWRHLANAGLIEGTYEGVPGPGGPNHSAIRGNVPPSRVSNAGWSTRFAGTFSGNAAVFDNNYGHWFLFGRENPLNNTNLPILSPEEAWNIDSKIDDGSAGRGNISARDIRTCTDASDSSDLDAEYLLSDASTLCILAFANAY